MSASEKEWRVLSSPVPGHNLPWNGDLPYSYDDKDNYYYYYYANIKLWDFERDENNYPLDKGFLMMARGSYKPNKLGIFDVIGNVGEMTLDGKIKGESWDNYIEECGIDKVQNYELPDPRVGCRIVMEVIER
jgi:formylglycine-generating enzyme required for sulfatase activity